MARLITYNDDRTPSTTDRLIGTDSATGLTKNFTLGEIADYFQSNLLSYPSNDVWTWMANSGIKFYERAGSGVREIRQERASLLNVTVIEIERTTLGVGVDVEAAIFEILGSDIMVNEVGGAEYLIFTLDSAVNDDKIRLNVRLKASSGTSVLYMPSSNYAITTFGGGAGSGGSGGTGMDGRGIIEVQQPNDDSLTFIFSDGTSETFTGLKGDQGPGYSNVEWDADTGMLKFTGSGGTPDESFTLELTGDGNPNLVEFIQGDETDNVTYKLWEGTLQQYTDLTDNEKAELDATITDDFEEGGGGSNIEVLTTGVTDTDTSVTYNASDKQAIITDLSTIRSGAAAGATALQSLPTITESNLNQSINDSLDLADSALQPGEALGDIPDGGIDEIKLDTSVNASLDKADSALQNVQTDIINTASTNGLQTYVDSRITTIGDIKTYADKTAFDADTTTVWHHGDVAIISSPSTTQLFTGTEGTTNPGNDEDWLTDNFHVITSSASLTSLGITATATELNQLDGLTLGTAAAANTGDFATSTQGATADTALQPGEAYADIADGAIDEVKLDTSVNASLDLADSALQPGEAYGDIADGAIDEVKLDTSVNASLDLADSALQPGEALGDIPANGITTAKLATSINTSLGKADSALQSLAVDGLTDVDQTTFTPADIDKDNDVILIRDATNSRWNRLTFNGLQSQLTTPRLAFLVVTNNITGPSEGYTITSTPPVLGEEGGSWTLTSTIALNSGYEWVTEPTGFTQSGTFGAVNVELTHTYTGEVRLEQRTATLTVTNNIPNTTISGQLTDTGAAGETWSLNATPVLDSGYEFVTGPTPATFTDTGVFGTANVARTVTFAGTTRLFQEISSIVLDSLVHAGGMSVVPFTVNGMVGESFTLSLGSVSPIGWITVGALDATTGTIGADGTYSGTLTIPEATVEVSRQAELIATSTTNTSNSVSSGLFSQIHTPVHTSGNLSASFTGNITGTTLDFTTFVVDGDPPFTAELFDSDPSSGSPTPIQTINFSHVGTLLFDDINVGGLADGDYTWYLRITELGTGTDILIETVTVTVTNPTPEGEIIMSEGFTDVYYRSDEARYLFTILNYDDPNHNHLGEVYDQTNDLTTSSTSGSISTHSDPDVLHFNNRFGSVSNASVPATVTVTDRRVTPNAIRFQYDIQWNGSHLFPGFSSLQVGHWYVAGNTFRLLTSYGFADDFILSYGVDSVLGEQTSVPAGSRRFSTTSSESPWVNSPGLLESIITSVKTAFDNNFESGHTYTTRAWVCDLDDPNDPLATIIYGPIRVWTVE